MQLCQVTDTRHFFKLEKEEITVAVSRLSGSIGSRTALQLLYIDVLSDRWMFDRVIGKQSIHETASLAFHNTRISLLLNCVSSPGRV